MDLVLATIGMIVALPVILVAAIAIKATSRGPVLFRQDRVTEGSKTFTMYKLRTMTVEAGGDDEVLNIDTSTPFFKMKRDPRLIKVGGWLRRWSVDELPQLFNVLRGDMSIVGPRPLPADQVAANAELLAPRHAVRAGITGWWQINGRSELDAEESIGMDVFYIENWSPTLDVYILVRTVSVLFTRDGAF
jgi:lipopolysaccharide/colanic/teichoic acid biosynthesis glycosyltransferase